MRLRLRWRRVDQWVGRWAVSMKVGQVDGGQAGEGGTFN